MYEYFLTFVKAESLNVESLSDYIIRMSDYNLDPTLIVSQGYDGTSVLSGSCCGKSQCLKMIATNAMYVYCYAESGCCRLCM